MIFTTVPNIAELLPYKIIGTIPGTPYDLAKNVTLFRMYRDFTVNVNDQLMSCKMDYARKILYTYHRRPGALHTIHHMDLFWERTLPSDLPDMTVVHQGMSHGDVKLAVDWVSHNVYWTDPMFRWIAMQPEDTYGSINSLYKVIVKEDLEKPYALAVDPLEG